MRGDHRNFAYSLISRCGQAAPHVQQFLKTPDTYALSELNEQACTRCHQTTATPQPNMPDYLRPR